MKWWLKVAGFYNYPVAPPVLGSAPRSSWPLFLSHLFTALLALGVGLAWGRGGKRNGYSPIVDTPSALWRSATSSQTRPHRVQIELA